VVQHVERLVEELGNEVFGLGIMLKSIRTREAVGGMSKLEEELVKPRGNSREETFERGKGVETEYG
jgi:hypothetical protein